MVKKTNRNVVNRGLYSYRQEYSSLLFTLTFFRIVSACRRSLQKFFFDIVVKKKHKSNVVYGVGWTLIENGRRHHSGQNVNVLDSRGVAVQCN